jgi:hypothetical protein
LTETATRCSAPLSLFGVPEDIYRFATRTENLFAQLPCLDWHSTVCKGQYVSCCFKGVVSGNCRSRLTDYIKRI